MNFAVSKMDAAGLIVGIAIIAIFGLVDWKNQKKKDESEL